MTARIYFWHLFFGSFCATVIYQELHKQRDYQNHSQSLTIFVITVFAINTLLYPYSRAIYEKAFALMLGNSVMVVPIMIELPMKFITICLCLIYAIPMALAYLMWAIFQNWNNRRIRKK
jgi:hypothetical protein